MRITKDLASKIAVELLSKKKEIANNLREEFRTLVETEYLKTAPKEVKSFAEKHNSYLRKVHDVRLFGAGFDHETVNLKNAVPTSDSGYGRTRLHCSDALSKRILAKMHESELADDKYRVAKQQVEATLLALGTYAKIREHFIEAAPFLKEPQKTCVALSNIDEVRKLVK